MALVNVNGIMDALKQAREAIEAAMGHTAPHVAAQPAPVAPVAQSAPVAEQAPAAPVPSPEAIPPTAGRPLLAWGARVSPVFRERVWWIADTFTAEQGAPFDPNNLMACMAWESGESFAPDKKNMAGSGATGLIQFMPTTAAQLGTSTAELTQMTAEDQLNFVYKYFKPFIRKDRPVVSLEDTYMCILWPKGIGQPNSYVLFDKATMATAYRQNAGLDSDHDGHVTKFECAAHVRDKLTKGLKLAA